MSHSSLLFCVAVEFKPRLERILREVIVLSEVAELATEAEILEAAVNNTQLDSKPNLPKKRHEASVVRWSPPLDIIDRSVGSGDNDNASEDDDEDASSNSDNDADSEAQQSFEANRYRSSGQFELLHLLDQWDEPKNVMDKVCREMLLGAENFGVLFSTNVSFCFRPRVHPLMTFLSFDAR